MDNVQLWKIGHHIRVKPGTGGIRAGMGRQDDLAGHQMGPHASVHYEAWPNCSSRRYHGQQMGFGLFARRLRRSEMW
jgi:hypothetical protein